MRRRSVVILSGASVALVAGIIGCTSETAKPSRELPAVVADGKPCVKANIPVATRPPGTDTAGSSTPGATIPTPDFTVPEGPPPSELKTIDLKEGTGAPVKEGDTVTANYIGVACSSGTMFGSSWHEDGQPLTSPLGQLIPGWGKGMVGMKEGGVRELIIPPGQAYGDKPKSDKILAGETLVFVVELIKTETPPPTTTTTAAPAPTPSSGQPGTTSPTTAAPGTTAVPK